MRYCRQIIQAFVADHPCIKRNEIRIIALNYDLDCANSIEGWEKDPAFDSGMIEE